MAGNTGAAEQESQRVICTTGDINNEFVISNSAVVSTSPPPYSQLEETEVSDHVMPPAYDDAVKLPTYQEVEDLHRERVIRDMFGLSSEPDYCQDTEEDVRIGTDFGFMVCFLLSFLLNWIGLLAGYCFSTTVAGQYGALSGFGLSLVKWGLLIKHSKCCSDVVDERPWIIWLFVITGWLIFLRGALAYIQVKRAARGKSSLRSLIW